MTDLEKAIALLRALVSDDPCTFDHNGWCQAHYRDPVFSKRGCANEESIDFLAEFDQEQGDK